MNDVIIIGGGPAGSAMGSYLSKAGISNVLLEANHHPRPHVGESMVMSSVRVFDEIGFLSTLESEGFVHKLGASWHEIGGREAAITFSEFPQAGIQQAYTYHVDRSKLDLLMLKHAQNLGTQVYQGVSVKEILFDGDRACGVRARIADQEVDLKCRMLVDASGRQTVLGRQLGLKKNDPIFDQFAVHAWFDQVRRGQPETADYIHIYFLPVERGWAWQIPITEGITSMGIVAEKAVFRQFKGRPEEYFKHYVQSNKALSEAMAGAVRLNDSRPKATTATP
jgi:FADH2 O2-dependent halogenase